MRGSFIFLMKTLLPLLQKYGSVPARSFTAHRTLFPVDTYISYSFFHEMFLMYPETTLITFFGGNFSYIIKSTKKNKLSCTNQHDLTNGNTLPLTL